MAETDISTQVSVGYARYAESASMATRAVSADIAGSCSGNAATATRFATARKVTFTGDSETEFVYEQRQERP